MKIAKKNALIIMNTILVIVSLVAAAGAIGVGIYALIRANNVGNTESGTSYDDSVIKSQLEELKFKYEKSLPRIGDIEVTLNEESPEKKYPGTEWEKFGQGQSFVGIDEDSTEAENRLIKVASESHTHQILGYLLGPVVVPSTAPNSTVDLNYTAVYFWKRIS